MFAPIEHAPIYHPPPSGLSRHWELKGLGKVPPLELEGSGRPEGRGAGRGLGPQFLGSAEWKRAPGGLDWKGKLDATNGSLEKKQQHSGSLEGLREEPERAGEWALTHPDHPWPAASRSDLVGKMLLWLNEPGMGTKIMPGIIATSPRPSFYSEFKWVGFISVSPMSEQKQSACLPFA